VRFIFLIYLKLFYILTKKNGMGHGDFKLFAAFGAWFGWQALLPIILAASVMGSIIGLAYLLIRHQSKDTPIPFGPFLCLAGWGYLVRILMPSV
jgi:leader peptidase (prepilin peptidase)/N-methyltransferase